VESSGLELTGVDGAGAGSREPADLATVNDGKRREPLDSDRARLGEAIRARRLALDGMSVSAAAKLAKVDRATWTQAESGTKATETFTAARIEAALRWAPGSLDAILAGDEPTELPELAEPERPAAPAAPPEPTLEQEIERLRTMPGLSGRERRAALRALIDFYAGDIDEGAEERPTA